MSYISAESIELKLNVQEANDVAWALEHDIRREIETHWKNYPTSFMERNKDKIRICEEVFASTGMFHHAKEVRQELLDYLAKLSAPEEKEITTPEELM